MMTSRNILATRLATTCLFVAISTPAFAANLDTASVVKLTCAGIETAEPARRLADITANGPDGKVATWRAVSSERLAYFMATANAMIITPAEAETLFRSLENNHHPATASKLWDTVAELQDELVVGHLSDIQAFNPGGRVLNANDVDPENPWSMATTTILRCKLPEARSASVGSEGNTGLPSSPVTPQKHGLHLDIRVRGTTDALKAVDDDRAAAPAATISFNRTKEYLEDGTRQTATTWSGNAVVGIELLPESDLRGLLGYVGYEYKGARILPQPTFTPPATARDTDTDLLKFGLFGHTLIDLSGKDSPDYETSLNVTIDASYLFNFVKDSERFRARVTGSFYNTTGIPGVCRIGGFSYLPGLKIWTRCDIQTIADFNVVTRPGKLTLNGKDTYGHIGGAGSFALYLGETFKDSPFISINYLHTWRIGGNPAFVPDIEQFKLAIGHRWWKDDGYGIEIRAEYLDGTNPDSFADENSITVGFGIIF